MTTPGLFVATPIPLLEQVVNFAQARHGVLAGNLANIDTPGYRSRDLDVAQFQSRLKEAIRAAGQAPRSSVWPVSHGNPYAEVREGLTDILFHDDSDVSVESQVAEVAANQMQHNLALVIMGSQFRLLQSAIAERP